MTNTCFSTVVHLNLNNNDLLELLLFYRWDFIESICTQLNGEERSEMMSDTCGLCMSDVPWDFPFFSVFYPCDGLAASSATNATPAFKRISVQNEQWTVVHLPLPYQFVSVQQICREWNTLTTNTCVHIWFFFCFTFIYLSSSSLKRFWFVNSIKMINYCWFTVFVLFVI